MRSVAFSLLCLVSLACLASEAKAEPRTITIDFGDLPARLPAVQLGQPQAVPPAPLPYIIQSPPPPIFIPVPPVPAPLYQPVNAPPPSTGYCPTDCCADGSCLWGTGEYLRAWLRDQPIPVLAARGGSSVIGPGGVNGESRPGFRVAAGVWFDECHTVGLQAGYFRIGSKDSSLTATTAAGPLDRPFLDVQTGLLAARPVAAPGGVTVNATSDGLTGFNLLFRENAYGVGECGRPFWVRVDVAVGYAYHSLAEGLTIREFSPGVRAAEDRFAARNEFHGGQIGLMTEVRRESLFVQLDALVALGVNSQTASVVGATVTPTGVTPGGLLAQPSNAGLYRRDNFSWVPQVGLKAGWQVADNIRLTVGYQFLFWSGVARPGEQIDLGLNAGPAGAGPPRPAFTFRNSDVWSQALAVGLEITY